MARDDTTLVPSCRAGAGRISDLLVTAIRLQRRVRDWLLARTTVKTLRALDDRTLKDIGLSRGEINETVRESTGTSPAAQRANCEVSKSDRRQGTLTTSLQARQMIGFEDCGGVEIHVRSGLLWITQADDYRDIIVEPGEFFRLDRRGLALVTASQPSTLTIAPLDAKIRSRLRFE